MPAVLSVGTGSGLAMNRESCLKEEREMVKRDEGLAESLVLPVMLFWGRLCPYWHSWLYSWNLPHEEVPHHRHSKSAHYILSLPTMGKQGELWESARVAVNKQFLDNMMYYTYACLLIIFWCCNYLGKKLQERCGGLLSCVTVLTLSRLLSLWLQTVE